MAFERLDTKTTYERGQQAKMQTLRGPVRPGKRVGRRDSASPLGLIAVWCERNIYRWLNDARLHIEMAP